MEWIVWDPNKAIDIGEWSACGGGWLERFYCIATDIGIKNARVSVGPDVSMSVYAVVIMFTSNYPTG